MKKRYSAIIVFLATAITTILLGFITSAYAKEEEHGKQSNVSNQKQQQTQIQLNNENEESNQFHYRQQIKNKEFTIMGVIEDFGDNWIKINSKTIKIDTLITGEVELKGKLAIGKKVKIEGIIDGETYYAKQYKIIGSGQGRFQDEIENDDYDEHDDEEDEDDKEQIVINSPSPTSTPIASPSPIVTAVPSVSPNPIVSPLPEESIVTSFTGSDTIADMLIDTDSIDKKVSLLEDMGIEFQKAWEQILKYLKGLSQ